MYARRGKPWVAAFLGLLSFLVASATLAADAAPWLESRVQTDGRVISAGDIADDFQATAEALHTFVAVGQNGSHAAAALNFINSQVHERTEPLARQAIARTEAKLSAESTVASLESISSPEGGFGEFAGYDPTPLDTAFALEALAMAGRLESSTVPAAIEFLRNTQRPDGSWRLGAGGSSLYVTAIVVRALNKTRSHAAVDEEILKGGQFLLSRMDASGATGNLSESALALLALVDTPMPRSSYSLLVEYLTTHQGENGSWGGQVYTTALATRALRAAIDTPAMGQGSGGLHGRVSDKTNGEWIAGVQVYAKAGTIERVTETTADGFFELRDIPAGEAEVSFSHPRYLQANTRVGIAAGRFTSLDLMLAPSGSASALTIQGRALDATTRVPLAGVSVTVEGVSAGLTTGADGRFSLPGLSAGTVALSLSLANYGSLHLQVAAPSGGLVDLGDLMLTAASGQNLVTLRGKVLDALSKQPLRGVQLSVAGTTNATTYTDGNGEFAFDSVAAGTLQVSATLTGYYSQAVTLNAVGGASYQVNIQLVIAENEALGSLKGRIVDATSGQPLSNAFVEVHHGDEPSLETRSSVDGSFYIGGIQPGGEIIRLDEANHAPLRLDVTFEPGELKDLGVVRLGALPPAMPDPGPRGPDLEVVEADFSGIVTDLQTFRVTGEVKAELLNNGDAPAASTSVWLFEDRDGDLKPNATTDRVIASMTVEQILPGEKRELSLAMGGELGFRGAPVVVMIDAENKVPEFDENNNTMGSNQACCAPPTPAGGFLPVVSWNWPLPVWSEHVTSVPLVSPLIDTNGDGKVDRHDDPAIVFYSYGASYPGTLRVVNGKTKENLWSSALLIDPMGVPAVGDVDGDGVPEIAVHQYQGNTSRKNGGLALLSNTGQVKWISNEPTFYGSSVTHDYAGITMADLDGDGRAEILINNVVLNGDGTVRWKVDVGELSGWDWSFVTPIVADLDMDGASEVILGKRIYRADGTPLSGMLQGRFFAVANLNDDPYPEIIGTGAGSFYCMNYQGKLLWEAFGGLGMGGAPLVADVDGDGNPEVGAAFNGYYSLVSASGQWLWSHSIIENSGWTGSSAFDFNGDGKAEIVYSDEEWLYIFEGATGKTLYQIKNVSRTAGEHPTIADLDGDGHAEIVLGSDGGTTRGLRVIEDAEDRWSPAREVWNQFDYHVTNVTDEGGIPAHEEFWWLKTNNYRTNVPSDGISSRIGMADLTVGKLTLTAQGSGARIAARIGNAGTVTARDFRVSFFEGDPLSDGRLLGEATIAELTAGSARDIQLDGIGALSGLAAVWVVVDPDNRVAECDETNNRHHVPVPSQSSGGDINVGTDAVSYEARQPVTIQATVGNPGGLPAVYRTQVTIVDASGQVVIAYPQREVGLLGAGASRTLTEHWDSGSTLAGNYRVEAKLLSDSGEEIGRAWSTFDIRPSGSGTGEVVSLRTLTDRYEYNTTDRLQAESLLRNVTSNLDLRDGTVVVTVVNQAGGALYRGEHAVGGLVPGGQRELLDTFAFVHLSQGEYQLNATYSDTQGRVLAQANSRFMVRENPQVSLTGRVSVTPAESERGQSAVCTEVVENRGTTDLMGQALSHAVAAMESGTVVETKELLADIPAGKGRTFVQTIATGALTPGYYECILQANLAGNWKTLGHAGFKVVEPPIKLETSFGLGNRGRLLVLLDAATAPDLGQADAARRMAQQQYLEALLERLGWSYTLSFNSDTFTRELRSGEYLGYLLLSETVKLPQAVQKELREAVYRGEGLVVAGSHDERDGIIDEALGIRYQGQMPKVTGLTVSTSPVSAGGQTLFTGERRASRVASSGAEVIGRFNDDTPAVLRFAYGEGRSVFAGFDLLAEATLQSASPGLLEALLSGGLNDTHPEEVSARPGGIVPLALSLTNQGMAVDGRIRIALPAGYVLVDSGKATVDGNLLTWEFNLAVGASQTFTAWLWVPETVGELHLNATIETLMGGSYRTYEQLTWQEMLTRLPTLSEALTALAAVTPQDATTAKVRKALERAQAAEAKADAQGVVTALLDAADEIARSPRSDLMSLRVLIDRALLDASYPLAL